MASNGEDWGLKRAKGEGGHYFNKNSKDYDEEDLRRKRPFSDNVNPNNVLLFTIINPSYPITTDILHTICKSKGSVVRIVVFRKNGVQAMIEFETVESAKRVKESLDGADIYAGCCTLKIDYAKPTKLNVYKNDSETFDYTQNFDDERHQSDGSRPKALLPEPPRLLPTPGPPNRSGGGGGFDMMPPPNNFRGPYPGDEYFDANHQFPEFERSYNSPVLSKFIGNSHLSSPGGGRGGPGGFGGGRAGNQAMPQTGASANPNASSVLMVYELDPNNANPDKIFNLFCLYGNVIKIKFLKTKEGCCMVQMSDTASAERAMNNLARTPLVNGKKLAISFSKQAYLSDVSHPYELPDKTLSFKDFSSSRNNRFMNPRMAMKNRIQPPTELIHFFNAPPSISEEELVELFRNAKVEEPKAVNIFPTKASEDRPATSSSGLIEFSESQYALDAIMQCNHYRFEKEGAKYPMIFKLCFSSARSVHSTRRGEEDWE